MHGISAQWRTSLISPYAFLGRRFVPSLTFLGTLSISLECALVLDSAPIQLYLQACLYSYALTIHNPMS